MSSDSSAELLTTAFAGDGQIHLALALTTAQPEEQQLTLCRKPVTGQVSARRFHTLGCRVCAGCAVRHGVTSIQDLHHATVNLPRFLAAGAPSAGE